MKKFIKSRIFCFMLGAVIFSSISAYAYSLKSSDISFKPENSEWQVTNIEEAVNDLYEVSNTIGDYDKFSFVSTTYVTYANHLIDKNCEWIENGYSSFKVVEGDTTTIECLSDGEYQIQLVFGGKFNNSGSLRLYINDTLSSTVGFTVGAADASGFSKDAGTLSIKKGDIIRLNLYRPSGNYCGFSGISMTFTKVS